MSSKKGGIDTPEWVNRDEVDSLLQQARSLHTPQSAGPQEYTVAFEKSPSKTPATPGFGPTPFYGASHQQNYNNVLSPKIGK